jgi:hypothetical protein
MSAWMKIAHTDVGAGGAANIEFTNITGSYTDLIILLSARSNQGNVWDWLTVAFNGNAASYSGRRLYGSGTAVSSNTNGVSTYLENGLINGNTSTANIFANVLIYIPNYSGNTNKSVFIDSASENNGNEAYQHIGANLWANTSAITSITLDSQAGGSWQQYSSATLYGITSGSSGGVTVS